MCIFDLKRKKKVTHLGNWDCLSGKQYTKHVFRNCENIRVLPVTKNLAPKNLLLLHCSLRLRAICSVLHHLCKFNKHLLWVLCRHCLVLTHYNLLVEKEASH